MPADRGRPPAAATAEDGTERAPGRRAAALPPELRRQAIVDATLPLVLEHGVGVTTRQIAEAAGIAEGTIFRVFADKEELMGAILDKAFDPAPLEQDLLRIDPAGPLEARLVQAVDLLQQRVQRVWRLIAAIGVTPLRSDLARLRDHRQQLRGLVALIEPHRHELRFDPEATARRLRAVAIAGCHPMLIGDQPLSAAEVVSLFLDGVRAAPVAAADPRDEVAPC